MDRKGVATLSNYKSKSWSYACWSKWKWKNICMEGSSQGLFVFPLQKNELLGSWTLGESWRSCPCNWCESHEQRCIIWSYGSEHKGMDWWFVHSNCQKVICYAITRNIIFRIIDNVRGELDKRQWIIFDGDVDPEWVENLNSVLDDNKLLTLPNGERLSIPPNVRMIFEVSDLKYATLATVSRCGMVWFSDEVCNFYFFFYLSFRLLQPKCYLTVISTVYAMYPLIMN